MGRSHGQSLPRPIVVETIAITLKTKRESAAAGYRGLLWPFKIRRMAVIVFQFRVVAGVP
jgi:hypothetical protein